MKFDEVIGQEDTKQRLLAMAETGRLPHALLLCGPHGCGKMATAMAFAAHLLGDGPMLQKWEHPDLHFSYPVIRPAGASSERKVVSDDYSREWHDMIQRDLYFTLDQWLERMNAANQQALITAGESDALTRKLSLKSSQGGYKVSLIWLPERMNTECANKLLKLLEEPPAQTLFLLVSEAPDQLLETIRSRTQRIDMRRIDTGDIEQALTSRRGVEAATAQRVARMADGSWVKAMELLDTASESHTFFELFAQLMRLAYMRNVMGLKHWSEAVAAVGREKQKRMLDYFIRMVRENFVYNFRRPELNYMSEEEEAFAQRFSPYINEANVVDIAELYAKARRDIAQNANGKIVFYELALQMIVLLIRK